MLINFGYVAISMKLKEFSPNKTVTLKTLGKLDKSLWITNLNSPRPEVVESAIRDLNYHADMFELMGLGREYKMNIHVGGVYKDKGESIKRFYDGFYRLEERVRKRIVLENDDKIYNAEEVLNICGKLKIPMVLDIHHDLCNPSSHGLEYLIEDVFSTWKGELLPPVIHLSSPKSQSSLRSHHDYINPEDLLNFLSIVRKNPRDFDVMVEAKMKDLAVFKLMDDIKDIEGINRIGDATIELK